MAFRWKNIIKKIIYYYCFIELFSSVYFSGCQNPSFRSPPLAGHHGRPLDFSLPPQDRPPLSSRQISFLHRCRSSLHRTPSFQLSSLPFLLLCQWDFPLWLHQAPDHTLRLHFHCPCLIRPASHALDAFQQVSLWSSCFIRPSLTSSPCLQEDCTSIYHGKQVSAYKQVYK